MGWFIWSYKIVFVQLALFHSVSCANLCSRDQSSALFQFKQHFSYEFPHPLCNFNIFPKTKYWEEDIDCCSWEGVTCDMVTGHVIGLDLSCGGLSGNFPFNSSLFLLSHLQKLNLAFNFFGLSQIPSDFVQFSSLTYLNLSGSSFSGLVPFEISRLSKLVSLDLGGLDNSLTLETHVMKGLVQNMTNLEELSLDNANMSTVPSGCLTNLSSSLTLLNLSNCRLQGSFPVNIFRLPSLHTLDLSLNYDLRLALPKVNWSSALKYLDVSRTGLSRKLPDSIGNLKFLSHLRMMDCKMIGSIPTSVGNLTQISVLDLSYNNFCGHIPSFLSNLKQLTKLYLGDNNFIGEIPDVFVNLTQLFSLSLDRNSLFGPIPSSVGRLQKLVTLSLSGNSLNGTIPSWLFQINSLLDIDLSDNRFHGPIPSSIFGLNLTRLSLSSNNLSGEVELAMFAKLKYLEWLDLSFGGVSLITQNKVNSSFPRLETLALSSCNINEFPMILANNLLTLDLSNNKIHGHVPNGLFNMTFLTSLNLSNNFLTGIEELPWQHLQYLDLHSNLLQGVLPSNFLQGVHPALQTTLLFFSAAHNNLTGAIPSSFCNLIFVQTLDLSNNSFNGVIPQCLGNLPMILYLNLRMNNFHGSIPDTFADRSELYGGWAFAPYLFFFSVSNNNLSGSMPSSFCNLKGIRYLDLSNNSFYGVIPQCLGNFSTIMVLDLKMNNFHGSIPDTFANGSKLITLNLNLNQLEGPLPPSLVNCGKLEVLDLGNNMVTDTFPHWLATLPQLRVLILKSNKFHGPLVNSMTRIPFSNLRIFDISHNEFTGHLRMRFFKNFQAMMIRKNNSVEYMGDDYYQDSVIVSMKGTEFEMQRILTIFTTMDLSCNKFHGRIPEIVGKLNSLKVLNFSHNTLTGHIPVSFENLTELESLDLSSNQLKGEILKQLTSLTFLSVLNLSYNQLEGPIPLGPQFNTFQNDSYIGNLGLCGWPLSKKCGNVEAPESEPTKFQRGQNTLSWFDWKIIMMGYGSGLVIGLSMGYLVFSTGKPWWLASMIERKVLKLSERHKKGSKRRRN